MKTLVILFVDNHSLYGEKKVFGGKSAFDLGLEWAEKSGDETVVVKAEELETYTEGALIKKLSSAATEKKADSVLFSFADLPFLNDALTEEIKTTHEKYKAEYTYADGYPYGFAPEEIDSGLLRILVNLLDSSMEKAGSRKITRDGIFELLKTDINSFEIETVLSDEDFRLWRLRFDASSKQNLKASENFYKILLENKEKSLLELCKPASQNENIIKTLPFFYNIQITEKSSGKNIYVPESMENPSSEKFIKTEDFKKLIEKISDFSETSCLSLSAFGEPLLHPEILELVKAVFSKKGLRLLIETDGQNVTDSLCGEIKKIVSEAEKRGGSFDYLDDIAFIVRIDAATPETYGKLHGDGMNYGKAVEAVSVLSKYFPGKVYAQFMRMNANEEELESFWRFWNEKSNASGGNLVIQKYMKYCGTLPEEKPADLSPLVRNPCWHLRRDMTILCDGTVPLCAMSLKNKVLGNAFKESLEDLWNKSSEELKNHIKNEYCELCRKCDEYYTFNF